MNPTRTSVGGRRAMRAGVVAVAVAMALCLSAVGAGAQSNKQIPAPVNVKAPPARAARTSSGLRYIILRVGKGKTHPTETSEVSVNYTGWTTDGKTFDTTVGTKPLTFQLDLAIKGWIEGVQLMTVGEKRRFWIPEEIAYRGRPNKPAGMLVFDIELLSFTPPPAQ